MSRAKPKVFVAGEHVEFQPDTWSPWRTGVYERRIEDMRGHHWVACPGETKELDLTSYGYGIRIVPATYIVPTRRVRKPTNQ